MRSQEDIVERKSTVLSQYVTLNEKRLRFSSDRVESFYSLSQADYVSVLAKTADQQIILVKQFRPAVEAVTLELPGGLLDAGEDPAQCAARELAEETGFVAVTPPILLAVLNPDPGRLENRFWAYFAGDVHKQGGWQAETNVQRVMLNTADLRTAVSNGTFKHALHIAAIGLAHMYGHLTFN